MEKWEINRILRKDLDKITRTEVIAIISDMQTKYGATLKHIKKLTEWSNKNNLVEIQVTDDDGLKIWDEASDSFLEFAFQNHDIEIISRFKWIFTKEIATDKTRGYCLLSNKFGMGYIKVVYKDTGLCVNCEFLENIRMEMFPDAKPKECDNKVITW